MVNSKEVQIRLEPLAEKLNLIVFKLMKKGLNPSKISLKCNISKSTIQYHLNKLKAKGIVRKVGYGTWEFNEKTSAKPPQVTKTRGRGVTSAKGESATPDSVRSHAFQFKLWLKKDLRNWNKREDVLKKRDVDFVRLNFGQKLMFKGRNVWLCDRAIIVYEKASYWADTADDGKSYAVADFLVLVRQLERFLGANFLVDGKHLWKVSRQHHSLVKNGLAIQYNREGKRLQLFDENGYWGCIDDSLKLKEFETLHPKTADVDNKKVQDYFNGVKKFEGYTPQLVMDSIGGLATNFEYHSENMRSHVGAVQELGKGVKALTRLIKKLGEKQ